MCTSRVRGLFCRLCSAYFSKMVLNTQNNAACEWAGMLTCMPPTDCEAIVGQGHAKTRFSLQLFANVIVLAQSARHAHTVNLFFMTSVRQEKKRNE